MAGTLKTNSVTLGDSATDSQNFQLRTNVDGTATLARGAAGDLGDILTVDASGKVGLPTGVGLTSVVGSDYVVGTWTVSPNSLTVVGTPTYTGNFVKIGRQVSFIISVTSTTSTSSTAGVTTFNLPFISAFNGVCVAVNRSTVSSYGCGVITNYNRLYPPAWAATQHEVNISGTYFV